MRLSILTRLILGNVVLLVIAANMGLYAIVELGRVTDVTRSIVLVDNTLVNLHKVLTDALLAERRYEKKYLIDHDPALYKGFLKSQEEFARALDEARGLDIPEEARALLNDVADLHLTYAGLFAEEADFLRDGAPHDRAWYAREKELAVNASMDELSRVRLIGQASMVEKVKRLSEAGARTRTFGMIVGAITLLVGLILSVLITRSITRPLAVMREKTKDIAAGVFETDIRIDSPPEIGALAQAFNTMCGRLNEVDKMKCNFFSLMSHELRTPLTAIKEGTNLFLEGHAGEVSPKQKKLLTIISEESNRLIELVNSVLDLSKLEAGMEAMHFTRANMSPLIERVVMEVGPLAEAKRIRLERKISDLPAVTMDVERMLQVVRNLVGNALKFTPAGGTVSITARREDQGVLVTVADTGPGIPKEYLTAIFDRFRQVPGARKLPGTGLGLAIVRQIVQIHGGKVWVESEAGKGCVFSFHLPG